MRDLLGMLDPDYQSFPVESVNWQAATLAHIPKKLRINLKFVHCGIRYRRPDGKLLCLFSTGEPIQYDSEGNFTFTFNYVQNVAHLLKKDWKHYWIRLSYGPNQEYVQSLHSATLEDSNRDLLSAREKEIVELIAQDYDTKEIAEKLFISVHTVGNHRSNMIERLGVRDTTALVQLAKLAGIV
jgi:DNA-binding CsgD family transcriptional regulator